jgi:hypothetical protein
MKKFVELVEVASRERFSGNAHRPQTRSVQFPCKCVHKRALSVLCSWIDYDNLCACVVPAGVFAEYTALDSRDLFCIRHGDLGDSYSQEPAICSRVHIGVDCPATLTVWCLQLSPSSSMEGAAAAVEPPMPTERLLFVCRWPARSQIGASGAHAAACALPPGVARGEMSKVYHEKFVATHRAGVPPAACHAAAVTAEHEHNSRLAAEAAGSPLTPTVSQMFHAADSMATHMSRSYSYVHIP